MPQVGDMIRLETTFLIDNTPTDPTTVVLVVNKPDGSQTTYTYTVGVTIVRDSAGAYHADILVDQAGDWAWKWTGTGAATGVDEGSFYVPVSLLTAGHLCTLDEVRDFLEIPAADTSRDDLIAQHITRASARISRYAGREFTPPATNPTARRFFYTNGDFISLAPYDLRSVTSITLDPDGTPVTLTADTDYYLEPAVFAGGVYQWLRIPTYSGTTRRVIEITGTWGFERVPEDVRHAAIVTVASWLRRDVTQFGFDVDDPQARAPFGAGTYGLPASVRHILDEYRVPVVLLI